jgi:hypothetical protein
MSKNGFEGHAERSATSEDVLFQYSWLVITQGQSSTFGMNKIEEFG